MSLTAFRLSPRSHADRAFSGEGARRWGGRWNPTGIPVIYASGTLSLACLEFLAHFASAEDAPELVSFRLEFDSKWVTVLSALPVDWREASAPRSTQTLGEHWWHARTAAVLRVPSVIIPSEENYLLNPSHPDFRHIKIGAAEPFSLDARLWQR